MSPWPVQMALYMSNTDITQRQEEWSFKIICYSSTSNTCEIMCSVFSLCLIWCDEHMNSRHTNTETFMERVSMCAFTSFTARTSTSEVLSWAPQRERERVSLEKETQTQWGESLFTVEQKWVNNTHDLLNHCEINTSFNHQQQMFFLHFSFFTFQLYLNNNVNVSKEHNLTMIKCIFTLTLSYINTCCKNVVHS